MTRINMAKPELDRRYNKVKRDKAELTAEKTRLRGELHALQGRIGEVHLDAAQDKKANIVGALAIGTFAGLAVGTIAGIAIGRDPAVSQDP